MGNIIYPIISPTGDSGPISVNTAGNITGSGTSVDKIGLKSDITLTSVSSSKVYIGNDLTVTSAPGVLVNGESLEANGHYSHVEGEHSIADGNFSHAEGFSTKTIGPWSHSEGSTSISFGTASHAEGFKTVASGSSSHAEGYSTLAKNDYSHTEGLQTTSSADYQHVKGKWNALNSSAISIIGAGTSNTDRKNIVTVYDNRVTIGTDASSSSPPARVLEVARNGDAYIQIGDLTASAVIGSSKNISRDPFVGSNTNHDFVLRSNNQERVRVLKDGDFVVLNSATVSGSLTARNNFTVTGSLTASGDVKITGNCVVTGTVSTDDYFSLNQNGIEKIHFHTAIDNVYYKNLYGGNHYFSINDGGNTALINKLVIDPDKTQVLNELTCSNGAEINGSLNLESAAVTSSKGILLNAANDPLITRNWDPFSSGGYSGVGRWGLFMESSVLTLGIPGTDLSNKYFKIKTYKTDSTGTDVFIVKNDGTSTFYTSSVNTASFSSSYGTYASSSLIIKNNSATTNAFSSIGFSVSTNDQIGGKISFIRTAGNSVGGLQFSTKESHVGATGDDSKPTMFLGSNGDMILHRGNIRIPSDKDIYVGNSTVPTIEEYNYNPAPDSGIRYTYFIPYPTSSDIYFLSDLANYTQSFSYVKIKNFVSLNLNFSKKPSGVAASITSGNSLSNLPFAAPSVEVLCNAVINNDVIPVVLNNSGYIVFLKDFSDDIQNLRLSFSYVI